MGSFTEYTIKEKEIILAVNEKRRHLPKIYLYESKEENGINIINTDLTRDGKLITVDEFVYSIDPSLTYTDLSRCCTRLAKRLLAMGETEYVLQLNQVYPGSHFQPTQTDHASKLEDMLRIFIKRTVANCFVRRKLSTT